MELACFLYAFSPVESVLGIFYVHLSRSHELRADQFAADIGYKKELEDGLVETCLKNVEDVNPDWLWAQHKLGEPTIVARLERLERHKKSD